MRRKKQLMKNPLNLYYSTFCCCFLFQTRRVGKTSSFERRRLPKVSETLQIKQMLIVLGDFPVSVIQQFFLIFPCLLKDYSSLSTLHSFIPLFCSFTHCSNSCISLPSVLPQFFKVILPTSELKEESIRTFYNTEVLFMGRTYSDN